MTRRARCIGMPRERAVGDATRLTDRRWEMQIEVITVLSTCRMHSLICAHAQYCSLEEAFSLPAVVVARQMSGVKRQRAARGAW